MAGPAALLLWTLPRLGSLREGRRGLGTGGSDRGKAVARWPPAGGGRLPEALWRRCAAWWGRRQADDETEADVGGVTLDHVCGGAGWEGREEGASGGHLGHRHPVGSLPCLRLIPASCTSSTSLSGRGKGGCIVSCCGGLAARGTVGDAGVPRDASGFGVSARTW